MWNYISFHDWLSSRVVYAANGKFHHAEEKLKTTKKRREETRIICVYAVRFGVQWIDDCTRLSHLTGKAKRSRRKSREIHDRKMCGEPAFSWHACVHTYSIVLFNKHRFLDSAHYTRTHSASTLRQSVSYRRCRRLCVNVGTKLSCWLDIVCTNVGNACICYHMSVHLYEQSMYSLIQAVCSMPAQRC